MQTQVTKRIDFTGRDLFIGLDVHKKSWSVTIIVDGMVHRTFTQPPDPDALQKYLQRAFPGGNYQSAYEAGYCGYGIHRKLNNRVNSSTFIFYPMYALCILKKSSF